jgi:hypothetical protein
METKIAKAKYYPKTSLIVPIKDNELVLIGEESALEKARKQKGVDETFEENGRFIITNIVLTNGHYVELLLDARSEKTISEEEWTTT